MKEISSDKVILTLSCIGLHRIADVAGVGERPRFAEMLGGGLGLAQSAVVKTGRSGRGFR